jgi:hypothetical protein
MPQALVVLVSSVALHLLADLVPVLLNVLSEFETALVSCVVQVNHTRQAVAALEVLDGGCATHLCYVVLRVIVGDTTAIAR